MKLNMTTVWNGLTGISRVAWQTLKHHAPTIFTVGGVLGIVGAGVMACAASRKLDDKLDECAADIQEIRDEEVPENDADAKKTHDVALAKAYVKTGLEMAKLYGPSVALGTASITAILAGKKIMDDRYTGAVSALSVTERLFAKYRDRVREELGEEKDKDFRYGIREQSREEAILDKNGEPKRDKNGNAKTKLIAEKVMDPMDEDEYARMFEETSTPEWTPDYEYNIQKITLAETFFTQRLRSRGWLCLNEVYEYFGFPVTAAGQDMGWVVDDDDPMPVMDFGLRNVSSVTGLRRMDSMDSSCNAVLLTFEGLRYIKDKIYKCQKVF